jgi:hypothetical protein
VEEDLVVLLVAVLVVTTLVVLVHTVLRHYIHIQETSHQDLQTILFVLVQLLVALVADAVLVDLVADSVVAHHMYKVQD